MTKQIIIWTVAIIGLSTGLAVAFMRGAGGTDDDGELTYEEGEDEMAKKKVVKKSQAKASKEVFKARKEEPKVDEMVENYNADNRTDTGVKVTPQTDKFQDHHSLDEGVDTNAPHVDPGHIRNASIAQNVDVDSDDESEFAEDGEELEEVKDDEGCKK